MIAGIVAITVEAIIYAGLTKFAPWINVAIPNVIVFISLEFVTRDGQRKSLYMPRKVITPSVIATGLIVGNIT